MSFKAAHISYKQTGYYSSLITDYLENDPILRNYYNHTPDIEGIKASIAAREKISTNRSLLVQELKKQYAATPVSEKVKANVDKLLHENTFTICTAHQPNIFTGHLYFIYKILHTIKLAEQLKIEIPGNVFVPVFYMGSEDADLEELGHVYINGIKRVWETKQTGAVGRMIVDIALVQLLDDIAGEIAIHPFGTAIVELMKQSYIVGSTIEQATFKLLNEMFGEYGLIVLMPDNPGLKKIFIPVVEKELKELFSNSIVDDTVAGFPKEYKIQKAGRELNMFYLKDDTRERIVQENSKPARSAGGFKTYPSGRRVQNLPGWQAGSKLEYDEGAILMELQQYPERFSPNVILRPVFQEMILPNIAFIGGGGELAYWLLLKKVFEAVNVPFPVLVLRNSFMLVEKNISEKAKKMGFTNSDLFKTETDLLNEMVKRETPVQISLEKEKQEIHHFYTGLKNTAAAVDITLQAHSEALEKLALRKIEVLEKKMLRAEKKKYEVQMRQLKKLKSHLFPHNNLQERVENFMPFYAKWGNNFIKAVYENSLGLEQEFVVLEEA